jgi:hypothetical protein
MSMVAEECALLDGYQARASEEIPDWDSACAAVIC